MLQIGTKLRVIDNSGAASALCIGMPGNKKTASLSSIVLITLRGFINSKKIKKRTIYLGLVVAITF